MRDDGGVAGKGRVVCVPKFYSWVSERDININSDWMSKASSGVCIILLYYSNKVIAPQDAHRQ